MNWNWFFEELQKLMFESLYEKHRSFYITDFLSKIERLESEVSELKSELENK